MKPSARLRVARTHRLLGMIATVPLVGWVASSFVLHGVGLALPNGLQGVYDLVPHHAVQLRLEDASARGAIVPPARILEVIASDGLERIYWLRLELLGGTPAYVVKPGPFELERVYDARSASRLDPLSDEVVRRIGDGALVDTRVADLHAGDEFNRYYAMDRVPAAALRMEGAQPSEVVLSRASGRTLRRTDPAAAAFEKAYRSVHVWQWGDALRFFTALLYTLVGLTLTLVVLGYAMWFDRRDRRRRWTDAVRRERRVHARLAPVAGVILATQMLVGAYLWFSLGLIEPRFRGQGSFAEEWSGGISVEEDLADAATIAAALPAAALASAQPIQRYEWRAVGDRRFWIAYPERNVDGILVDAATGESLLRLTPELAARAGAMVVAGVAAGPGRESTEYWMDYNARVPTYLFRFTDADDTDVHVSQVTGEVVQRRPAIWRAFGPFLAYHTFAFSGNPWIDTLLLSALQLVVLGMLWSGWRVIRSSAPSSDALDSEPNQEETMKTSSSVRHLVSVGIALALPTMLSAQTTEGDVVAAIDAYHAALASGDSTTALALLAEDVTILESGAVEDKEHYRSGHLAGDIRFAQAMSRERGRISVHVVGDVAWAWSTSVTQGRMGERVIDSQGAELMVLQRTDGEWLIKAIHWSSRPRR